MCPLGSASFKSPEEKGFVTGAAGAGAPGPSPSSLEPSALLPVTAKTGGMKGVLTLVLNSQSPLLPSLLNVRDTVGENGRSQGQPFRREAWG